MTVKYNSFHNDKEDYFLQGTLWSENHLKNFTVIQNYPPVHRHFDSIKHLYKTSIKIIIRASFFKYIFKEINIHNIFI